MPNRALDWLRQADRHEWACFAAQQAAEKVVKALHRTEGARSSHRTAT